MPFGQPQNPLLPQGNDPYAAYRAGSIDIPQHPMAAAVQPRQKVNWLGVLADALSGAAGQTPLYTQNLMLQKQQDQEEQTYQRHRADQLDMWKQQQQFELEHPHPAQPTEYERALEAAGYAPGSPEYVQHVRKYVDMKENPVQAVTVTNPDGSQEIRYIRPNQMGQQGGPVGKLTPIGAGGQASGSGGFR